MWRVRPPARSQADVCLCWAAAISSYTHVTPSVKTQSTRDIVRTMALARCVYGASIAGALRNDERTRRKLRELYGLTSDHAARVSEKKNLRIDEDRGFGEIPRAALTVDTLAEKLRLSHVVLSFTSSPYAMWRTVLVYGVDRASIYAMDPWDSTGDVHGTAIHGAAHYRKYLLPSFAEALWDYTLMWRA